MSEALTDSRLSAEAPEGLGEADRAGRPLAEMAEQIRRVDEAAAQAAGRVQEAADRLRAGAGSDFRSQLLADLGTSLVERVNEIRAEADRLSRMLSRATKLAGSEGAPPPASPQRTDLHAVPEAFAPTADRPSEPQPSSARQPDRRRSPGQATPEGVRLAATQMAVAGSSRSEIERCLRVQFGVHDADAALDEIFGTRSSEVR